MSKFKITLEATVNGENATSALQGFLNRLKRADTPSELFDTAAIERTGDD